MMNKIELESSFTSIENSNLQDYMYVNGLFEEKIVKL